MILQSYNSEAGQDFRKIIQGRNLITPKILGYKKYKDDSILEVSKSESGNKFGVTVIRNNVRNPEYSRMFRSRKEMEDYVYNISFEDMSPLINLLKDL